MANFDVAFTVKKAITDHLDRQMQQRALQDDLPKSPLELWLKLNELGFFVSGWGGKDNPWQPDADQWSWFRWAIAQQGCTLFLGARGIGKTEILTVFRIVYEVVNKPNISILVITGTSTRSRELIRLVHSMLHALGIPLMGDAKTKIRTTANIAGKHPTVYSASVGSQKRGDHPDLIIIEDPLDEKDGYSDAKKTAVMTAINECRRMAYDNVFMIGQFVAEDDPFAQFCQAGAINILTAWASQVPAHLIRDDKAKFVGDGTSQMLNYSWAINMEGEFPNKEGELFSQIDLVDIDREYLRGVIGVLDPAFGGKDKTALAIGGTYFDNDLQKDVLVAWVFSWAGAWHSNFGKIVQAADFLGIEKLLFEGKKNKEIEEYFGDVGIRAEGFDTTENKLYKIERTSGFIAMGRLTLHAQTADSTINTIRHWHAGKPHDDEVDALAMLTYKIFRLDAKKVAKLWSARDHLPK
jgi:hypothetical protein